MNSQTLIDQKELNRLTEPLVSIIVMTYNSAKYVLETLESAQAQTYQNIELIVTDDCSSDNTVELVNFWINEHKNRFFRNKVITTPVNTGIPANCNRGAKISKGEWIKIIAGDDILLNDCVASYIKEIANDKDLRFITSDMLYINNSGEIVNKNDFKYDALRRYFFNLKPEKQLKIYARLPLFINSPSFFIHKITLQSVNYFDEEFTIYDDMPLIFNVLEKGIGISYIEKKTVKYRIYENSLSRTRNNLINTIRINEQIRCFNKYRKKYLKKTNIVDLFVFYDFWLEHCYKGVYGFKGLSLLNLINFYPFYLKYLVNRYKKM